MIGYHACCGGPVRWETRSDGYVYRRCSRCSLSSVHESDILSEQPQLSAHKRGRKKKRKPRYDIKSWKEVKA